MSISQTFSNNNNVTRKKMTEREKKKKWKKLCSTRIYAHMIVNNTISVAHIKKHTRTCVCNIKRTGVNVSKNFGIKDPAWIFSHRKATINDIRYCKQCVKRLFLTMTHVNICYKLSFTKCSANWRGDYLQIAPVTRSYHHFKANNTTFISIVWR